MSTDATPAMTLRSSEPMTTGELLIRIDTKLDLFMQMFESYKLDVRREIDSVWTAIDDLRSDVGQTRKFEAEMRGAGRSLNWLTHLLVSLPSAALAGVAGFFAGK